MKQSNFTVQVIEPSEGYTLTNTEHTIFSKKIFLAVNDNADNYFEITDEEAQRIIEEQEQQRNEDNNK